MKTSVQRAGAASAPCGGSPMATTTQREDIFLCVVLKLSLAKCHPVAPTGPTLSYSTPPWVFTAEFSLCACHRSG